MSTLQTTKPKHFCFVLMPFSPAFSDIYEFGIKGACSDVGIYCERVDEQVFYGSMLDRIYSQIARADILVADMTGKNPNVFYEVGYAHALGKNVVLLTSDSNDIPFDLKHFPHIVYSNEIKTLRASLSRTLKHLTTFEESNQAIVQMGLELFHGKSRLADEEVVVDSDYFYFPEATLTLINNSAHTYPPGEFRLAVIAPVPWAISRNQDCLVSTMPDGTYMHMLPEFDTLFPSAATTVNVRMFSSEDSVPNEVSVTLRIFSSNGTRDFSLKLRRSQRIR